MAGKYLGTLLMEKGLLTTDQVEQVLLRQRHTGQPFGRTAVEMFNVRMTDVWRALAAQQSAGVRRVDLSDEPIDEAIHSVLPARFAWALKILPLRYVGRTLLCATTTKALPDALAALAERLDHPLQFVIADELQLKSFIIQRYPM
jgi:hypothetical protein